MKTSWGRENSRNLRRGDLSRQGKGCSKQKTQQEPGNKAKLNLMCPEDRQQITLAGGGLKEVRYRTRKSGHGQIQEFRFYSVKNNQRILSNFCYDLNNVLVFDYKKMLGGRQDRLESGRSGIVLIKA